MGSQQTIKPESGLVKIPANYPTQAAPGKLESLLIENQKSIYQLNIERIIDLLHLPSNQKNLTYILTTRKITNVILWKGF